MSSIRTTLGRRKSRSYLRSPGCTGDKLSEQTVKGKLPPNVICTLPGRTDQIIVVGAHTDKVSQGHGVVDNWSGASLLPSLYYSLDAQPRHSTYLFIGFTGEEKGMVGSDFYVHHLTPEQRAKIVAMVNMDTLGVGPSKVWASHSDKSLLAALAATAAGIKLPITVSNVDRLVVPTPSRSPSSRFHGLRSTRSLMRLGRFCTRTKTRCQR